MKANLKLAYPLRIEKHCEETSYDVEMELKHIQIPKLIVDQFQCVYNFNETKDRDQKKQYNS